jgi:hypothetical protein
VSHFYSCKFDSDRGHIKEVDLEGSMNACAQAASRHVLRTGQTACESVIRKDEMVSETGAWLVAI